MSLRYSFYLIYFLFFFTFPGLAIDQDFRFERITREAGLSNSEVNSIIQDSTGFIWIGTRNGLNRFDGNRFLHFFHYTNDPSSVVSNDIRQLYPDNGDDFWIATNRGVGFYNGSRNLFFRIQLLEEDGSQFVYYVNQFSKDRNGNIIAASSNGLYRFNRDLGHFAKYPIPSVTYNFLNWEGIQSIATDNQNRLWLGSLNQGLFIYDQDAGTVIPIEHIHRGANTLMNNKIFFIFQDSFETMWVGTETGLYVFDRNGGNGRRYLPLPGSMADIGLPHPSVNSIYEDSSRRLWVLTNGGVSIFNRETGKFQSLYHQQNNPFSLGSNAIRTMFEDRQSNLWLGSVEDGINLVKTRNIHFNAITRSSGGQIGLNHPHVLSIEEDSNNDLWIGTNGGGINVVNSRDNSVRNIVLPTTDDSTFKIDAVMALFKDNTGRMWAGTYLGGITVYNPNAKTWKIFRHDPGNPLSLSNDVVNYISRSPDGYIMAATNRGVNLFDPQSESFSLFASASDNPRYLISNDFTTHAIFDNHGNCWIATYYGLNRIDLAAGKVFTYFANENKGDISDNASYFLFVDSRDILWIGTENGLNRYDYRTDSFNVFNNIDGLPTNTINAIEEDDLGYLWLSTNNGLSRYDAGNNSFSNFNMDDGIATIEFSIGAVKKGSSGQIYFGGRKGVVSFDPAQVKAPDFSAPLVLTSFAIHNLPVVPGKKGSPLDKTVNNTQKLVLTHEQSFFSIDFTILDFVNPRKGQFQYKLEGFDHDWVPAGINRSANYTRLPAGKYTFRVRALLDFDRIVYSNPLEIKVKPPIMFSTPAFLIYFILFSLMVYGVWRFFYERAMYKRRAFVERLESEKLIELNQSKLKFFINVSHEFKTPLTLILSPLEKLLREGLRNQPMAAINKTIQTAHRNAMRLSRLITQIMELRKIDSGEMKLNVRKTNVVEFVKNIGANYDDYAIHNGITYLVESTEHQYHLWFDRDMIETALFNLLGNAFRFTPEGGAITVVLDVVDNQISPLSGNSEQIKCFFRIRITDSGPGIRPEHIGKIFDRFYQANNDLLANPASTGIGLSIVKEFIELHKGKVLVDSTPGHGAVFSVYLPVGQEHFKADDFADNTENAIQQFVIADDADRKRVGVRPFFHDTARGYPHKILVVEDNHELRNFILDNLESKYEVHEASNGREGLRLANVVHPDLIITDIMMPGISGIDFTHAIKTDINTSHIPVILMTVLDDVNIHIQGMETGADSYIQKPFHFSVLEANIQSLIENRRHVISKFLSEEKPKPENITLNKMDQALLNKAFEVLEKNMDNEDFSAEDFSDQMNMSRSNLHVKLKALTNLSATEFIRTVRLKKAVELLASGEFTVSQVASMVGFKSISYFNRCFKNTYGQSPSNYL